MYIVHCIIVMYLLMVLIMIYELRYEPLTKICLLKNDKNEIG